MAFASRCGLDIALDAVGGDPLGGAVHRGTRAPSSRCAPPSARRVAARSRRRVSRCMRSARRRRTTGSAIARARRRRCSTSRASTCTARGRRPRTRCSGCATTRRAPTRNTTRMLDAADPGLSPRADVRPGRGHRRAVHRDAARGRAIAILREQGVNGQVEMAAAFDRAGFAAVDVHMTDILAGPRDRSPTSAASSPAAASPTATCSARARAGPSRSCSTRARATSSRRSSRAPTRSRSACATAAR